ncbi:MAG: efflux RND transporter permease subunit [Gemmatimonadota bacterium]|nr:efflux RND transporter permease subunit [Gemmatimonadota bacterium]
MFISDFSIRRPTITVVAMLALVIFGSFALITLKTDEYPDVAPPYVTVAAIYPGGSPDIVEKEVLDPIEEALAAISGVKKMMGRAEDGYGFILIEFEFTKPLAEATQDVRDAISAIRNDLPPEMEEPLIKKMNDTDLPIVSLALTSPTRGRRELTQLADPGITREIRSINGVAEVTVTGQQERELTVELRPDAMQAAGVSVTQVVLALQTQNLAAPVGRIDGDFEERSIRLRGRLEDPTEFARVVVAQRGGRMIRLGEVATVRDGAEEPRSLALYDDREAVGIDIRKSKGYSTTDIATEVLSRVERIRQALPEGVELEVVKDAGKQVDASVWTVKQALVEGALLTVLVVFLFLNSWRSTVITGLALPVSVLASFIAVWAFGFTLNTMSLLGLSLAIGILIDDAIVVRENIVRHVEMGKDHLTAAHEGTDEIGLAVTATTFSILAVFLPIAFMPGLGGQWFKPFALTMACAVFVSLLVSFSLDPMLSAYWPDPEVAPEDRAWITRVLDRFNAWFNRRADDYKRVIAWALDHRLAVVALAVGSFVFALAMVPLRLVGVGFVPEDDRAEMTVQLETPPGSNLAYTRLKAEEAVRIIRENPEVQYTYTTLGGGTSGAVDVGKIFVRLNSRHLRDQSAEEIARRFRDRMQGVSGVTLAIFTSPIGGGRKQLMLEIRGDDSRTLNEVAEQVRGVVAAVPNVVDLSISTKGQKPELTVVLDRGLASSMGVSLAQVAQSLRPAFAGIDVGDWVDPAGETRDVMVRLSPEARRRATDLRQLPLMIPGPDGIPVTIPLGQVATVTEDVGPAVINHLNREMVVNVEWNPSGRATGEIMADVMVGVNQIVLPEGVLISQGGDAQQQSEIFGSIFLSLALAALLMYLVLAMQFGSFTDPIAIMLSLPLSLIGVMGSLALTGNTVNIMSLIGVILLMGLVAKNAILLIDFAKWSQEREGMSLRDALIHAGAIRLRPILMTTFALIAGMIPVALGSGEGAQFRAPLGVAVIGGVLSSALLTLVAIPTFYEILEEGREALTAGLRKLTRARPSVPAPAPGEH